MRNVLKSVALVLLMSALVFAQNDAKKPPASPPGTASYSFADGKKVSIDYSRPYAKGRKIMGGLVPFGQVWRTGANSATSFVTDTDVTIGGTNVPAGKYTIYTLPGEMAWKLIINKQTGQWGTKYDQSQDLARIDMVATKLSTPMEQFTISFDKTGDDSAKLKLEWENTSATVDVKEKK